MNLLYWVAGVLVLLLIGLLVAVKIDNNAKGKEEFEKKKVSRETESPFWIKTYKILSLIPWVNKIQEGFYFQYKASAEPLLLLRKKSASITLRLLAVSLPYSIVGILFGPNFIIILAHILASIFTFVVTVNAMQSNIYMADLKNLMRFIEKLKDGYSQTKTINGAFSLVKYAIGVKHSKTAMEFLNILTGGDVDLKVEEYYKSNPNKYLKQLIALCHKILEVGDLQEGKFNSIFLKGLDDVREDIRSEYHYIRKLKNTVAGSSITIHLSFMMMMPAIWAIPFFNVGTTPATPFLESHIGLLVMFVMFVALCYFVMDFVMNVTIPQNSPIVKTDKQIFSKLLTYRFVRVLMHRLAPIHKKNQRSVKIVENTEALLRKGNSSLTVQEFHLQKIIYAFFVFVLAVGMFASYHALYKSGKFSDVWETMTISTSEDAMTKAQKEFEYNVIMQAEADKMTDEEFASFVMREVEYKPFLRDDADVYVNGLLKEYTNYKDSYLKWYEILISFVVSLLGWRIPEYVINRNATARRWEIQNEIEGYWTVLAVIGKIPSTQVLEVIKWMERYSVYFKEELNKVIVGFRDPQKVLQELDMTIRNDSMSDIIQKLETSVSDVPIRESFADLDSSREFMRADRIIDQDEIIAKKKFAVDRIGERAIVVVLVCILIVPIVMQIIPMFGPISTGLNLGEDLNAGNN